jgi:hypothetical protein
MKVGHSTSTAQSDIQTEVYLPTCLSVMNFDPNYLRIGKTEWAEIFYGLEE